MPKDPDYLHNRLDAGLRWLGGDKKAVKRNKKYESEKKSLHKYKHYNQRFAWTGGRERNARDEDTFDRGSSEEADPIPRFNGSILLTPNHNMLKSFHSKNCWTGGPPKPRPERQYFGWYEGCPSGGVPDPLEPESGPPFSSQHLQRSGNRAHPETGMGFKKRQTPYNSNAQSAYSPNAGLYGTMGSGSGHDSRARSSTPAYGNQSNGTGSEHSSQSNAYSPRSTRTGNLARNLDAPNPNYSRS